MWLSEGGLDSGAKSESQISKFSHRKVFTRNFLGFSDINSPKGLLDRGHQGTR